MSAFTATFDLDDWTAKTCRECGGSHGQLWMAGLDTTREEYEVAYDEMAHPWKYADRPRVSHQWHLFPRAHRWADIMHEASARVRQAAMVLRHGSTEDEWSW